MAIRICPHFVSSLQLLQWIADPLALHHNLTLTGARLPDVCTHWCTSEHCMCPTMRVSCASNSNNRFRSTELTPSVTHWLDLQSHRSSLKKKAEKVCPTSSSWANKSIEPYSLWFLNICPCCSWLVSMYYEPDRSQYHIVVCQPKTCVVQLRIEIKIRPNPKALSFVLPRHNL